MFFSCNQQIHITNKPQSPYLLDKGNLLYFVAQDKDPTACIDRKGFRRVYRVKIIGKFGKTVLYTLHTTTTTTTKHIHDYSAELDF
jgi:hypothetical protein